MRISDWSSDVCSSDLTASTHGGKRFVARRIQEGHHAALGLDVVGADVLGNAAGFAGCNLGAADIVQQRRLAVVDVTHTGNDGRARYGFGLGYLGHIAKSHGQFPLGGNAGMASFTPTK